MNCRKATGLCFLLVLSLAVMLSSCAEVPYRLNTIPSPPATGKIRIYLQAHSGLYMAVSGIGDWPQSHGIFAKNQADILKLTFDDLADYELVDGSAVQALFSGNQKPSLSQMKGNQWELARQIGKALSADYVVVAERGSLTSTRIYFGVSLINVETGKAYSSVNDENSAMSSRPAMVLDKLIEPTYKEIFRAARSDVLPLAERKRSDKPIMAAKPEPSVTPAIAAPLPVKAPVPEPRKEQAPPTIQIASPDTAGTKMVSASKIAVTGTARTDIGVAEVYVNGRTARLSEDGSFSTDIFLRIGANDVSVVAVDTQGNKGVHTFRITRQSESFAQKETAPPSITLSSPDTTRGVKVVNVSKITVAGKALSEKGVAEVTVNGENAALGEDGTFNADILLKVGENRVTVTALDTMGNKGTQTFTIQRQSQIAAAAKEEIKPLPVAAAGRYYALIVGNNNYKHMPKLRTARKDAVEVEKILSEKYGFTTKLLLDATRNDLLGAINSFRKSLGESDNLLIFYAGHGEFDKIADKSYWLPVDARTDDDTNWIIADDVTSNLKRISSRHILVVADSCYAGTLTRSYDLNLSAKGNRAEYLKKMQERLSRSLIASGGNEPVSDGGGSGHSVFADAFLKGLKEESNAVFSAEELFYGHIKERVAGKSDQVPEYNTIKNSGHDGGDFLFSRTPKR